MSIVRAAAPAAHRLPPPALPRADHAVVVLGCATYPDGTPQPPLRRRLLRALAELLQDPRAVAVVTGGAVSAGVPEAHGMKRFLVAHGVDPRRVVIEDQARLTLENAELAMPMLRGIGARRLTLVTERYHMARSRQLFDRALAAAGLAKVVVREAAAPDDLDPRARVARAEDEAEALARDLAQQGRAHAGTPLAIVLRDVPPPQPMPPAARPRLDTYGAGLAGGGAWQSFAAF